MKSAWHRYNPFPVTGKTFSGHAQARNAPAVASRQQYRPFVVSEWLQSGSIGFAFIRFVSKIVPYWSMTHESSTFLRQRRHSH
nr:hypothetical protein [uncultured Ottowia sp.]